MLQREPAEELEAHDHEAARRLVERYGWQLIPPEGLARRALKLIAAGRANGFSKALVGAYCIVMHQAFLGELGADQQRRACEELGRALTSLLARNYPGLAPDEREDVSQGALERIWRARGNCHEPVAFLAFAASHLLSAVQQARRQHRRIGERLKPAEGADEEAPDIPDEAPPLLARLLDKERQADIAAFLAELRQAHPRAGKQIDVLELRCLQDLDYGAIAGRLGISQANAHTKLSLICRTIRRDPELSRRARALGLGDLE